MLKLYPMPASITEKDGIYEFSHVSVNGIENSVILNEYTERGIVLSDNIPNVNYVKTNDLSKQSYELTISENGAVIFYSSEQGAFYGTQTLCQLINMKSVSFCVIKDAPLNKQRIFQFDISRGKLPTMNHFKEIIDFAAMCRFNVFSLYYESIVFQFPALKGLWENDSYTPEEILQIKKWCNEKFMKFHIGVCSFGHLANFLCHDRFKHLSNSTDENDPGSDLNPSDPRSVSFIDMLIGDVIGFCDTEFLFIGADEVKSLKTGKSAEAVAESDVNSVFMKYVGKICRLVQDKYNKIPLIYGDMFLNSHFSDEQIRENLKLYPDGAVTVCWGYESEYERYDFDRYNRLLSEAGIDFVNCGGTGLWAQHVPRTYNQMLNAEVPCRMGYENGAYAVVCCTWGDLGNSQYFVTELGGMFVFGATAWNCYDYQLSHVHEYMDKYVYKSTNGSMARTLASFGDAAWYAKGRVPESNTFAWVYKTSYTKEPLYDGYHAHTGIKKICLQDEIDEYGCIRALEHIENSKRMLSEVDFNYKDSTIEKEKIYVGLRAFELCVMECYFKLCVIHLKDFETAKSLVNGIKECYNDIFGSYKRLWLTENRESGCNIFTDYLKGKYSEFIDCVNSELREEI